MSPVRRAVFLGALVVSADWLSKFLAVEKKVPSLFLNTNTLFFGLLEMTGFFDSVLVATLLAIFTGIYLKYLYSENTLMPFALIFAGALANLIDGIVDGAVIDFIDIGISTLNLADFAIMGGIGILLINLRTYEPKN